jgi:hypothetical protein
MGRAVPIPEIEGTFENANDIVVGLLAPDMPVSDRYKMRVTDLGKDELSTFRYDLTVAAAISSRRRRASQ